MAEANLESHYNPPMSDLASQSCRPLRGEKHCLSPEQVTAHLVELPGWTINQSDPSISRQFKFPSFPSAIAFVNRVAELAERENHHPDILINYSKVTLTLSTHDCGGITLNDLILAAKLNQLLPPSSPPIA